MQYRAKKQIDVLYAFYDLLVAPASFDIAIFLVLAELKRKTENCSSLHVVIVPGPADGFRAGDLEGYRRYGATHYDVDSMRWRLRNVLIPCCWLISSCQRVTICTSREEAKALQASLVKHTFPTGYTVRFPQAKHYFFHIVNSLSNGSILPSIQATPQARQYVSCWLQKNSGGRKVISITLRENVHNLDRNSNLKDWAVFARSLDANVYCPVFIRDTEAALKPLPAELGGLTIFSEASWNVELRAALYELSYLNMAVNNGPALLFILNQGARYLYFKLITPSCGETEEAFRSYGVEPYEQLPIATPLQRYVWADDRLDVIEQEFKKICERIESSDVPSSIGTKP